MRCEVTEWQVVGDELARQLDYISDAGEHLCSIQMRLMQKIFGKSDTETRFCIVYAPAVLRGPAVYLAMQITPLGRLTEGPFVNARVTVDGSVNKFWVDNAQDTAKITEVLSAGEELRWLVVDAEESLLDMRLPHDSSFRTALTEMQAKMRGRAAKVGEEMFIAKLTGVFPKGVKGFDPIPGLKEPTETKEFTSQEAARAWLLGDGLHEFRWPIHSVEILSRDGQQVWRAYHSSNDVLRNKNEVWWYKADPGRREREKAITERRRAIVEGRIPREELSLKEQFELKNPLWRGPFFAWLPTKTADEGLIWLKSFWVRHTGLRYVSKIWYSKEE